MRLLVALACAGLMAGTAGAQQMSPEQAAAIAGDPVAKPQVLKLVDVPKPAGPARALFNGKDLSDWEAWLGYADPGKTYQNPPVKPLGHDAVQGPKMFSVVREDGAPALRVDGRIWGSLVHKAELADYHLSLEFKWGDEVWAPREKEPQNNGLLFHSGGPHGAVFGTWMRAMEFEIMKGSTGMVVPVGDDVRVHTRIAQDMKIIYPHRRFRLGGKSHDLKNARNPDWNVEAAVDAEKPVGEWNRLDLYVLGDDAVFVVNGVPVMVLDDMEVIAADGLRSRLKSGRIQLQSEGAETFFREIVVTPIKALPKVVVAD